MHNSQYTNHNEIKESIKRFELMEKGEKNFFFDVDTIEILFDFYIDKYDLEKASKILNIGIGQHPQSMTLQLKEAYILMEKEDYDAAINKLELIASIETANYEVYLNLAFSYSFKENISKVRSNLDLALQYVPTVDELIDLLYDIASFFNEQGKHSLTIEYVEPYHKFHPKNEDFILELAFAYFDSNHIDKAIDVYKTILDNDPFLENIWYNLGTAYLKMSDIQKSLEAFDFALAINPEHSFSYLGKSEVYELTENYNEAFDNLLEYISYSFDYIAYEKAAIYLFNLNKRSEAIRYLEIAVKKTPFYHSVWSKLISLLVDEKRYEEALKYVEQSVRHHARSDSLWHFSGIILSFLNKKEDALRAYKRAFIINQNNILYIDNYVHLMLDINPALVEIELLNEIVDKYPESSVHFLLVNYYLFTKRDLKLAGFHLDAALYETGALFQDFIHLFPDSVDEINKSVRLSKILLEFDPNILELIKL